jgi:putative lipoprotein
VDGARRVLRLTLLPHRNWRPDSAGVYDFEPVPQPSLGPRFLSLATCLLFLADASPSVAEPDPWWGQDKAVHFSACFVFAGDGYATASVLTKQDSYRVLAGFAVASAAGAAKELYDRSTGGDASWRDLTWDLLGATTGTAISWLIDRYLF